MAKTIADLETSTAGPERAQESLRLRELLQGGGGAADIDRDPKPGDPEEARDQPTRTMESVNGAEGGHGGNKR